MAIMVSDRSLTRTLYFSFSAVNVSSRYAAAKALLVRQHGIAATNVGEEGGFAPPISDPKACLTLIVEAIDEAGYTGKIKIGVAAAADSFHHDDGRYDLDYKKVGDDRATDGSNMLDTPQLSTLYKELLAEFPIVALEDPYHHEDFASFTALTADIGMKCQVVGDNLLVTNPKRVQKAVEERACNSLLVKVNQIGTVTETIEAVKLAKQVRVWARWGGLSVLGLYVHVRVLLRGA